MATLLPDSAPTQTSTMTVTRQPPAAVVPPPPPLEGVIESRLAARAAMHSAKPAARDTFASSSFAPWAAQAGDQQHHLATPPVLTIALSDPKKRDELRGVLAVLTGRAKATNKGQDELTALLGRTSPDDALAQSIRLRRTASTTMTFGQRATQFRTKNHELVAYVLRLASSEPGRVLELRITVKQPSTRVAAVLELAATAPVSSTKDLALLESLRQRLSSVWGSAK